MSAGVETTAGKHSRPAVNSDQATSPPAAGRAGALRLGRPLLEFWLLFAERAGRPLRRGTARPAGARACAGRHRLLHRFLAGRFEVRHGGGAPTASSSSGCCANISIAGRRTGRRCRAGRCGPCACPRAAPSAGPGNRMLPGSPGGGGPSVVCGCLGAASPPPLLGAGRGRHRHVHRLRLRPPLPAGLDPPGRRLAGHRRRNLCTQASKEVCSRSAAFIDASSDGARCAMPISRITS
jgi:hypothetical protein